MILQRPEPWGLELRMKRYLAGLQLRFSLLNLSLALMYLTNVQALADRQGLFSCAFGRCMSESTTHAAEIYGDVRDR